MKCVREMNRLPYREINLQVLGDISPLKPSLPIEIEGEPVEEINIDEEGFSPTKISRKTLWKNKISERRVIFSNMSSFLDGFF